MTVTLARRLVWEGVVTPEDVNAALGAHVRERIPFLRALVQRAPVLLSRLEGELGQARASMPPPILPDDTLVNALPHGLVETLLAIPVSRDPTTGTVRVLVADASDGHVATEISFHLGAPVELVAAPLRQLLEAVRRSEPPPARGRTPLFGVRAVERPPSSVPRAAVTRSATPMPAEARPSEPPIPLVRVASDIPAGPTTVKGVAPQAAGASYASGVVVPKRSATPAAEPIIQLTRTKSLVPAANASDSSPPDTLAGQPAPSPRSAPASLEAPLQELAEAKSAEDVVAILARALGAAARRVLVLAVRGKVFEGREASDPSLTDSVRLLVVSADRPSVLLTASQTGQYVGPVPQTLVHQELFRLLGEPEGDIAVGSVAVSGRSALLWVAAGLDTAYLATRRGSALGDAAGKALERIVRDRKK
ncbi:MAG TPA: hypothetical protein VHE30_15325 [Polyangiaceae bacterium]|nr:hypothetical protein [Polyangiaceae bacterium]